MRIRKKKTVTGRRMPIPKHTRHTVGRWSSPAADSTMRKTATAKGPPNCGRSVQCTDRTKIPYTPTLSTKFVTIMNTAQIDRVSMSKFSAQLTGVLEHTRTSVLENLLIGRLARARRRRRILAANALRKPYCSVATSHTSTRPRTHHARDSSGHRQAPEQSLDAAVRAMGRGAYRRAHYDQERRSNERRLAPDAVTQQADRDLSEHRTCSKRTVRISSSHAYVRGSRRASRRAAGRAYRREGRWRPGSRRRTCIPSDRVS